MDSRKRKSALENYVDQLTDPPEKVLKINSFYNNIKQFYRRKWNANIRLPCIQGVEINLFRLYETVMSLGGWQKVAQQERWPDVAEMLGIGEDVLGGDHAIKLLYMRYLSKYEQSETVGDIDDMMMDGEMSRSRGRSTSFFATNDCPISIGRTQQYLRRDERGNPATEPEYARVMRSLMSGLPNEVDFGVNVCTLLSHPGPRLLRLSHAPYIPTILVAHCGIFDEDDTNLSDLYTSWTEVPNRNFFGFWANSGCPKELLQKFVPQALEIKVDQDGELLSGIAIEYDVRDPISWRLNQIATIIRNFSFEPINRVTLAQCYPLMKFLFLCSTCNYVPLYTAAMDTLSNIACDIDLTWEKMGQGSDFTILRILADGLKSTDKFKLIRSMEVITGLCMSDTNETIMCDFLKADMFDRIFDVVCVKDIMMSVYALECLYQMSEMGDVACDIMVQTPRCIQQLVSMATLEAVSFGPAGLAGMKVVEYQPQFMQGPPGSHPMVPPHPQQFAPPQSSIAPPQVHHAGPPQTFGTPQQRPIQPPTSQTTPHRPVNGAPPLTQTPQRPIPNGHSSEGQGKVDQLTEQWIRTNCVADKFFVTPRGELYAAYVDDLRNQFHSLSGSLTMFSNVMKSIHPDVVFKMADNGLMMVAQGIRLVKPHRLAPAASANAITPASQSSPAGNHPLMKQILTKPSAPNNVTTAINGVNGKSGSSSESSRSNTPSDENEQPKEADTKSPPKEKEEPKVNGVTTNGISKEDHDDSKSDKSDVTESSKKEEKKETDEATEDSTLEMMCEWDGCGKLFATHGGVLIHCSKEHMTDELQPCKWPGCDGTPRSRWSLVTHIQDHHVQEAQLKAAAQRRRDGLAPEKPTPYQTDIPRDIPQHPGYAKHAAIEAIRRHAFNFLPRDITDEPEGPVTKSIRLTSCLILRNLARYSSEGRHLLRRHERHLCWLALSRLESSQALAQLLAELKPLSEEVAEQVVEDQIVTSS